MDCNKGFIVSVCKVQSIFLDGCDDMSISQVSVSTMNWIVLTLLVLKDKIQVDGFDMVIFERPILA